MSNSTTPRERFRLPLPGRYAGIFFCRPLLASFFGTVLLLRAIGLPVMAQEPQPDSTAAQPALATEIEQHLARVQAETSLDPGKIAELTARLREALALVEQGRADRTRTETLRQEHASAPQLLAQLAQQTRAAGEADLAVDAGASQADLEVYLSEAQGALRIAREVQTGLRAELESHHADRLQLGAQLSDARARLADAEQRLTALALVDPPTMVSTTAHLYARAVAQSMESRIGLLDEQRIGFDVRERLLRSRLELQRSAIARHERRITRIEQALDARRGERTAFAESAISPELLDAHPDLAQAAQRAREWTRVLDEADLAQRLTTAREELLTLQAARDRLTARFADIKTRLELLGRSEAAGILLRGIEAQVPDVSVYRTDLERRRRAIGEIQLLDVRLGRDIVTLEDELEGPLPATGAVAETGPLSDRERAEQRLHALSEAQLALLRDSHRMATELLGVLLEATDIEQRMIDLAQQLVRFVNERQLWVPNAPPITLDSLAGIPGALARLLAPSTWIGSLRSLGRLLRERPLESGLAVLVLLLAVNWTRRAGRYRRQLESDARARHGEAPPAWLETAAAWTVSIAGPVVIAAILGWGLTSAPDAPLALQSLGAGLLDILHRGLFPLAVLLTFYGPGGPVSLFAGWPERAVQGVHRAARVMVGVLLLALAARVIRTLETEHDLASADSAARLILIAVIGIMAAALHPILAPRRGVIAVLNEHHPARVAKGGLRLLYLGVMTGMAALVYVSIAGYLYAAIEFTQAILSTFTLTAVYAFSAAFVARRKAAAGRSEEADARERQRRLGALQVLLAILYTLILLYVLRELLPALTYLDSIGLWQTATDTGVHAVTAATLAGAIVMLVATVVLAWLVPSFFGVTAASVTDEGMGGRYATAMLARYLIAIVGTGAALSMLNIEWSKIQWLLAGLSVGLGFGLQESVANFISGLLLLSERPIRVGDMVSVGDNTGVVSQIRMRATTIRDFDGRELIVPNKELLTSQVTNWTLSDTTMRLQIAVGVAYGSDTALVERLLLEAAAKCPWILQDPAPRAVFELFGDNSLQFRLLAFVGGRRYLLEAKHWLHMRIERELRENGIEMAFPQRDVHLASRSPVEVRIVAAAPGPAHGEVNGTHTS